jgi:hypothetical protein
MEVEMETKEYVVKITREEAAHKMHAQAVDRVHRLTHEAESTFREVIKAQKLMKEIGVIADIEMNQYLAGWLIDFKTKNA